MRLDFFMLADGASSPDGKIYVHGGALTRVYPSAFPAMTLLTAVTRLLVEAGDVGGPSHSLAIEWLKAEEQDATTVLEAGDLRPEEPQGGFREGEEVAMVVIANMLMALPDPGSYEFRLKLDGDVVGTRRLYVTAVDDPDSPLRDAPESPGAGEAEPEA